MTHPLGLDIGGANLKAATTDGHAVSTPFAVWKHPERLPDALAELLARFPPTDELAVTMTAELADCFRTKTEGVERILSAVEMVAAGRPTRVWTTGGEFASPADARRIPRLVAAANWHALATWIGPLVPTGRAMLIDIGTTTTDIIPLLDGLPMPAGSTDVERLLSGELVYTGVRRTPLCALTPTIPFHNESCPLAAEWFATTLDVYLTLGDLPENPDDTETANNRPATIDHARDRLARAVCADRDEFTAEDALVASCHCALIQRTQIAAAVARVLRQANEPIHDVVLSGLGAFVAERVVDGVPQLQSARRTRLGDILPARAAEAACAFALARLAAER